MLAELAAAVLALFGGTVEMLREAGVIEREPSVTLVVVVEDEDAGEPDAAAAGDDAALAGPGAALDACAPIETAIARRKDWLAARRQEQFQRGGPYNPQKGVFSAAAIFCDAHPDDPDCRLVGTAFVASSDELDFSADAGVDDYEPHVLMMKRALKECRARGHRTWP